MIAFTFFVIPSCSFLDFFFIFYFYNLNTFFSFFANFDNTPGNNYVCK